MNTKFISRAKKFAKQYGMFSMLALAISGSALASAAGGTATGGDAEFGSILTMVTSWLTGSLGKLLALVCLAVGMAAGVLRQSMIAVIVGIAFALALAFGPGVISGIFDFAI